jgi:hypothetical protein
MTRVETSMQEMQEAVSKAMQEAYGIIAHS